MSSGTIATGLGPTLGFETFQLRSLGGHVVHGSGNRMMAGLLADQAVHLQRHPPIRGVSLR